MTKKIELEDKPVCPYRKGTIRYRLMTEDWSRMTISQIADELQSSDAGIEQAIYAIKQNSGYVVPYLRVPGGRKRRKAVLGDIPLPPSYQKQKKNIPHNCNTCGNLSCSIYARRKAIVFRNCDLWMQEEEKIGGIESQ